MKKVYVGNFPYTISENDLEELFKDYNIVKIDLIRDRETGRLRGFGFIEFATEEDAQKALSLNGQDFDGRPLKVNLAKERRSGGGGYGRRERY